MATSKSELMTFQLCAKLFNIPLSIQIILTFCACACPSPHPQGRWTDSSICDQTDSSQLSKPSEVTSSTCWAKLPLLQSITLPCLCIICIFGTSRSSLWRLCPPSESYQDVIIPSYSSFRIGYQPLLATRPGFVEASLFQFSPTWTSQTGSLNVKQHSKQWDHCWGMLTLWQLDRAG